MSYFDEMIATERIPDSYAGWEQYRREVTEYIEDNCREINENGQCGGGTKPTLALWGIGQAGDIDIGRLAKCYKLVLIDRDREAVMRAVSEYGLKEQDYIIADIPFWQVDDDQYRLYEAMLEDCTDAEHILEFLTGIATGNSGKYIGKMENVDFAGPSALELLDKYENLLVVQTFSKSRSMAGMRIGFAMGHPDLIRALNDVKYSYNSYTMNLPSLLAGVEAVKDKAYFESTLAKIVATRERSKKRLAELGFTFPDSRSNFIFASHKSVPAGEIFEALKKEQIYVRYFKTPGLDNSLRISIGTDEEMDTLFRFLEAYLPNA